MLEYQCPTVKIKSAVSEENQTGFILINESDFVEGVHERFDPVEPAPAPLPSAPKPWEAQA